MFFFSSSKDAHVEGTSLGSYASPPFILTSFMYLPSAPTAHFRPPVPTVFLQCLLTLELRPISC